MRLHVISAERRASTELAKPDIMTEKMKVVFFKKVRIFCSKKLKYVGGREGGWHCFLFCFVQNMRFFFAPTPYSVRNTAFSEEIDQLLLLFKAKIYPRTKLYLHTLVQVSGKLQKSFEQRPRSRSSEFKAFLSLEKNRTLALTFITPS